MEAHANVETIILDPMSDVESRQLVSWVAGDRPPPRNIVQDIIKRSDGVPLFIEEVTLAVIEVSETGDRGGAGRVRDAADNPRQLARPPRPTRLGA